MIILSIEYQLLRLLCIRYGPYISMALAFWSVPIRCNSYKNYTNINRKYDHNVQCFKASKNTFCGVMKGCVCSC